MIPIKTIEELINKHSTLEKDLSSGKIDNKLFAEKSKEYSDLNEIVEDAKKYLAFEKNKIELEKILDDQSTDKELQKMAENELRDLKEQNLKDEKNLNYFYCLKMRQIKKMQSLKLELGQVVLKQAYLQLIFLKCMKK